MHIECNIERIEKLADRGEDRTGAKEQESETERAREKEIEYTQTPD